VSLIFSPLLPQCAYANLYPNIFTYFQQFGEKQCGKERYRFQNSAQIAHFVALHIFMCSYQTLKIFSQNSCAKNFMKQKLIWVLHPFSEKNTMCIPIQI